MVVGFQIGLLVSDAPAHALVKNLVQLASLSIHADLDVACDQQASEGWAGEWTALIGAEPFGLAMAGHRVLSGIDAEFLCNFIV
jgi:hypothetical protein